jgi:hypothetical protein
MAQPASTGQAGSTGHLLDTASKTNPATAVTTAPLVAQTNPL